MNTIHATSDAQLDSTERGLTHSGDILREVFDRLICLRDSGEWSGISTGYRRLDALLSGLQASDLIVIAGRPGMGKSAFATSLALSISLRLGARVAYFSLEMCQNLLMQRLLSARSGVGLQKLFKPLRLTDDDFCDLCQTADILNHSQLFIEATPNLSALELRSKLQLMAEQKKDIDLVIIDYLQLMSANRQLDSREREIAEIPRALKGIAKEFNIPILVVAQLQQKFETGKGTRPQIPELHELGTIGLDADVVMFVHRDDAYVPENELVRSPVGDAKIIIAKQRHGPLGSVQLTFAPQTTAFEEFPIPG